MIWYGAMCASRKPQGIRADSFCDAVLAGLVRGRGVMTGSDAQRAGPACGLPCGRDTGAPVA